MGPYVPILGVFGHFSLFLGVKMTFMAPTPNFSSFNLEIFWNPPQKVTREPYIDLWWVPGGSNGTLKTSKSC